jgi:hypothetical protein
MPTIFTRSGFVWALVLCLVLTNGLMAAPSVAHAEHHGTHHDAGTHASGICAWLCAAGQEVGSASVSLQSTLRLVERTVLFHINPIHILVSFHSFFRGPPHFLA